MDGVGLVEGRDFPGNKREPAEFLKNAKRGQARCGTARECRLRQIVKEYSFPVREERRKYSPAQLVSVYKTAVNGDPVPSLASTSMIERANLTVRTHCKRLARLTLSFSKKKENFQAAIVLHLAYYNFVKFHGTLRMTPAMEAGVEKSAWKVSDLVDAAE